jgi:hypothetical protein
MLHSRILGAGGRISFLLLGLALLVFPSASRANVINVPANQPTIQAGINAAALFGDEVVVADGTYTGAGNRDISLTKNITVRSASRNPANCIIDCQTSGRGFLVSTVANGRLGTRTIVFHPDVRFPGTALTVLADHRREAPR